MTAIELTERRQVERGDNEPEPARERGGAELDRLRDGSTSRELVESRNSSDEPGTMPMPWPPTRLSRPMPSSTAKIATTNPARGPATATSKYARRSRMWPPMRMNAPNVPRKNGAGMKYGSAVRGMPGRWPNASIVFGSKRHDVQRIVKRNVDKDIDSSTRSGTLRKIDAVTPPPHGFSHGARGSRRSTSAPDFASSSAARAPAGPAPTTPISASYDMPPPLIPFCDRCMTRDWPGDYLPRPRCIIMPPDGPHIISRIMAVVFFSLAR